MSISLHQPIPDCSAPSTQGVFQLSAHQGKHLVVYFYPKNNTPGCTTEGEHFRDLYLAFESLNCAIVGVSRDTVKSHVGFKAKLGLPFELISDADETMCSLFEVIKLKNMYGKQVRGIERSTFVINTKGILVQEWRGVKVAGHAQAVLDFVQTIKD